MVLLFVCSLTSRATLRWSATVDAAVFRVEFTFTVTLLAWAWTRWQVGELSWGGRDAPLLGSRADWESAATVSGSVAVSRVGTRAVWGTAEAVGLASFSREGMDDAAMFEGTVSVISGGNLAAVEGAVLVAGLVLGWNCILVRFGDDGCEEGRR